MKAKYEQELKELLQNSYREDWMEDKDWNAFENSFLRELDTDYDKLSSMVEVGVENGYSMETQLQLLKKLLDGKLIC